MKASIVITNWNGKKILEKNLPSVITASKNKINKISEIILVDDHSSDESVTFLEKNYPEVKLIRHTKNRGFAFASNHVVRMAKSELIVLLNNDVFVAEDFLGSVFRHFRDDGVFAVSLHERGGSCATISFVDGFLHHEPGSAMNKAVDTAWVSGGSSVIRKSIWKKLGGFDDELFAPFYWEDVDLGYRAHKHGYKLVWEPKAHVVHNHETTINEHSFSEKYMNSVKQRNQLLFLWKNITSKNLFHKHLKGLLKRCLKHPGYLKVVFLALQKRKLVLRKRQEEGQKSIVSDEAVFAKFN